MEMSDRVKSIESRCWPLGFSIGPGWYKIVEDLDEKLTEVLGDYEIHQVKEKFGGLRYYIGYRNEVDDVTNELVNKIIRDAEILAEKTCEECGEPGTIDSRNGWYRCLCDSCRK